jgi:GDP/UDP-N,N'-diacetylbacillosamine 2-epimerase (hydrolysing)
MRRILAFTSNRSEYDLLSYLFNYLSRDKSIDFRVLVSGAHLSKTYGLTVNHIKKDGIKILDRIETLIDSDSDSARIKTASILLQNALQSVERFAPELIIYAGDREDVMIAALIGGYLKIATAHFFAGDHDRDGVIDNPLRHATSKLSAFNFASLEEHRRRLLSIGQNPERIFVIGSCALDKFRLEPVLSREETLGRLSKKITGFEKYALVIFHTFMDHEKKAIEEFKNILKALKNMNIPAVINTPNTDPGSRELIQLINTLRQDKNFLCVNNLERNLFVNLFRNAHFQIGNSSAGILEAASIPLPVINVGERMVGRKSQKNVIFADSSVTAIEKAISTATSKRFSDANIKGLKNIYGDGRSSERAFRILKGLDLTKFAEFRKEDPLFNGRGGR